MTEQLVEPLTDYEMSTAKLSEQIETPENKEPPPIVQPIGEVPQLKRKKPSHYKEEIKNDMEILKQQIQLQRNELAYLKNFIADQQRDHDTLKHNVVVKERNDKLFRSAGKKINFI